MARRVRRAAIRLERAALGAIMGIVAFVVERRLLKAIRRRGETTERPPPPHGAELSSAPQDVDH